MVTGEDGNDSIVANDDRARDAMRVRSERRASTGSIAQMKKMAGLMAPVSIVPIPLGLMMARTEEWASGAMVYTLLHRHIHNGFTSAARTWTLEVDGTMYHSSVDAQAECPRWFVNVE